MLSQPRNCCLSLLVLEKMNIQIWSLFCQIFACNSFRNQYVQSHCLFHCLTIIQITNSRIHLALGFKISCVAASHTLVALAIWLASPQDTMFSMGATTVGDSDEEGMVQNDKSKISGLVTISEKQESSDVPKFVPCSQARPVGLTENEFAPVTPPLSALTSTQSRKQPATPPLTLKQPTTPPLTLKQPTTPPLTLKEDVAPPLAAASSTQGLKRKMTVAALDTEEPSEDEKTLILGEQDGEHEGLERLTEEDIFGEPTPEDLHEDQPNDQSKESLKELAESAKFAKGTRIKDLTPNSQETLKQIRKLRAQENSREWHSKWESKGKVKDAGAGDPNDAPNAAASAAGGGAPEQWRERCGEQCWEQCGEQCRERSPEQCPKRALQWKTPFFAWCPCNLESIGSICFVVFFVSCVAFEFGFCWVFGIIWCWSYCFASLRPATLASGWRRTHPSTQIQSCAWQRRTRLGWHRNTGPWLWACEKPARAWTRPSETKWAWTQSSVHWFLKHRTNARKSK